MTSPLPTPTGSMNSVLHSAGKRPFKSRDGPKDRRRAGLSPTRAHPTAFSEAVPFSSCVGVAIVGMSNHCAKELEYHTVNSSPGWTSRSAR